MNVDDVPAGYTGFPTFDWYMGQVVQALIEDGKEELASILLACRLSFYIKSDLDNRVYYIDATIHGPMTAIRELTHPSEEPRYGEQAFYPAGFDEAIEVFRLVFSPRIEVRNWSFNVEAAPLPANWRTEFLEVVRKKGTTNQGLPKGSSSSPVQEYAGLRFRSATEIRIAKALDQKGVMYLANCTARLNTPGDRLNREPDFLICHEGHWGILEIDGEPFHPPSRAAQEHERDRLFKKHGVRCIERYDASRCYEEPSQVVAEFLQLLNSTI